MNKSASLVLALTLCALLLSGCGVHILPFPGMSTFHYEHPEKYSVGGTAKGWAACCLMPCAGTMPSRFLPSTPLPTRWRSTGTWASFPQTRSK